MSDLLYHNPWSLFVDPTVRGFYFQSQVDAGVLDQEQLFTFPRWVFEPEPETPAYRVTWQSNEHIVSWEGPSSRYYHLGPLRNRTSTFTLNGKHMIAVDGVECAAIDADGDLIIVTQEGSTRFNAWRAPINGPTVSVGIGNIVRPDPWTQIGNRLDVFPTNSNQEIAERTTFGNFYFNRSGTQAKAIKRVRGVRNGDTSDQYEEFTLIIDKTANTFELVQDGPRGAGKTTTFNVAVQDNTPSTGNSRFVFTQGYDQDTTRAYSGGHAFAVDYDGDTPVYMDVVFSGDETDSHSELFVSNGPDIDGDSSTLTQGETDTENKRIVGAGLDIPLEIRTRAFSFSQSFVGSGSAFDSSGTWVQTVNSTLEESTLQGKAQYIDLRFGFAIWSEETTSHSASRAGSGDGYQGDSIPGGTVTDIVTRKIMQQVGTTVTQIGPEKELSNFTTTPPSTTVSPAPIYDDAGINAAGLELQPSNPPSNDSGVVVSFDPFNLALNNNDDLDYSPWNKIVRDRENNIFWNTIDADDVSHSFLTSGDPVALIGEAPPSEVRFAIINAL